MPGPALDPHSRDWYRSRLRLASAVSAQPPAKTDPLAEAIVTWDSLRQSDTLAFEYYAGFLRQHPGWPGESGLRKAAERGLKPDITSPALIADFFKRFPPLTNMGSLRYAEALQTTGRRADAVVQARAAWVGGALPFEEENLLLGRFAANLAVPDNAVRMGRLPS